MAQAVQAYDRHVVSLEKCTEEFHQTLQALMKKAIQAYENRGPELRHGIALDKHVTVILSQSDSERPLCGIYFNLHSPYQRKALPKTVKQIEEAGSEAEV
jgi:predicted HAD superfamily Cof-like phosphohydrolase